MPSSKNQQICAVCKGKSKTKGGLNNDQLDSFVPRLKYENTRAKKIRLLKKIGVCNAVCKQTKQKKTFKKKISKKKISRKNSKKTMTIWTFSANAYLLKEKDLNEYKVDIVDVVPKNKYSQIIKEIQDFGSETLKISFQNEDCIKNFDIFWEKNKVFAYVYFLNETCVKETFKSIVDSYHEGAMDGYLEGDASIYKNMEFILDDFQLSNGEKIFKEKNYWV